MGLAKELNKKKLEDIYSDLKMFLTGSMDEVQINAFKDLLECQKRLTKEENKMKVFVIQEELQGIVEDPRIFLNEKDADKCYIAVVNENFNQNFEGIKEAVEFMSGVASGGDYFVRYWELNSK